MFDADAWLARIGCDRPRAATLAALRGIVAAQARSIPFENIGPLVGDVPKLDVASLQDKLVRDRRGGYCFEHNLLLRAGLQALGFEARALSARVVRGSSLGALRVAGHAAVRVELPEGAFLADTGYGNLTPTAPLVLAPDVVQETPHETMRFVTLGDELVLEARLGGEWEHFYRLCNHAPLDADLEVANWFVATYPGAIFVENMVAALAGEDGRRHTFLNGRSSVRHPDGRVERRLLQDADAIGEELVRNFRLTLPLETVREAVAVLRRKGNFAAEHSGMA